MFQFFYFWHATGRTGVRLIIWCLSYPHSANKANHTFDCTNNRFSVGSMDSWLSFAGATNKTTCYLFPISVNLRYKTALKYSYEQMKLCTGLKKHLLTLIQHATYVISAFSSRLKRYIYRYMNASNESLISAYNTVAISDPHVTCGQSYGFVIYIRYCRTTRKVVVHRITVGVPAQAFRLCSWLGWRDDGNAHHTSACLSGPPWRPTISINCHVRSGRHHYLKSGVRVISKNITTAVILHCMSIVLNA